MEQINEIITRILNIVLRKIEGMKRNISYSEELEKRRVNVLYRKIQLRKMREIVINKELIEKRR